MVDKARLIHETANGLIQECYEDYVGIWLIVGSFEMKYPNRYFSDEEIREMALEVIREMLGNPDIRAGTYDDRGFAPWELSTDQVLARIKSAWIALGVRSPHPFLIVTLVAWP